jgi:hypothetical protein
MNQKAGRIYINEMRQILIAMHADQKPEFYAQRKVMVEVIKAANTLFPEMNEEKGTVKKELISLDKLKLVGFIN